jgi:hypothetical protein
MQHWPFSCFLSVLSDCSYELLFILYTNQIIRESTSLCPTVGVSGDKKSWPVFFGTFFSGAGAGFSLFASMKMKSADTCVNLCQQRLASTAETNSISRNKLGQQSAFWWHQQRRFLTVRSSGRIFIWTLWHLT